MSVTASPGVDVGLLQLAARLRGVTCQVPPAAQLPHEVSDSGNHINRDRNRVLRGLESAPRDRTAPASPLTARELKVLRFMASGYSNREIADVLGVAEGTVKNHTSSILSTLGVRDHTRAVLTAIERCLI